jgi:hypothetical protein
MEAGVASRGPYVWGYDTKRRRCGDERGGAAERFFVSPGAPWERQGEQDQRQASPIVHDPPLQTNRTPPYLLTHASCTTRNRTHTKTRS